MALSPRMSTDEIWESYVKYFSFAQLRWLFDSFCEAAVDDLLRDHDALSKCIEDYLKEEWGGSLFRYEVDEEMLQQALGGVTLPTNFFNFTHVLHRYVSMHLHREECAGFNPVEIELLNVVFESHHTDKRVPGLQGKALFDVLSDLGISFHSKEERQWYVETVQGLDNAKNGSVSFPDLCHIIRRVEDMDQERNRLREFNLVKKSGLAFDEVEDWFKLFHEQDHEGTGDLERSQMKDLITSIGVTWDNEVSETISKWVDEADENSNGKVDFGEFCIVVSKMWATNLQHVREASRKFMAKEATVSILSVSNSFLGASTSGDVSASSKTVGTDETFTLFRLPSGNILLQSAHGPFLSIGEDNLQCIEGKKSEFKVKILEDERVLLAGTGDMGNVYAKDDGKVGISDGNPILRPFFPFNLVFHDDLTKKSWSKVKPTPTPKTTKRKPSKVRTASKRVSEKASGASLATSVATDDPGSPGLKQAIQDMDQALQRNAALSAR